MVKIKKIFLFLVIIFGIIGCTPVYEFKEKEGYIFNYEEEVSLMKNSIFGVKNNYELYLDRDIRDTNSNLTLFPMEEKEFELTNTYASFDPSSLEKFRENGREELANYFKKEEYMFYPYYFMKSKIMVYIDICNENYVFRFAHTVDEYVQAESHYGPYRYNVSAIECDGVFGYVLSYFHNNDLDEVYEVLYLLANTPDLGYEIYYLESRDNKYKNIYLIPENENFSRNFIEYFNNDNNIHYLNIEEIKKHF